MVFVFVFGVPRCRLDVFGSAIPLGGRLTKTRPPPDQDHLWFDWAIRGPIDSPRPPDQDALVRLGNPALSPPDQDHLVYAWKAQSTRLMFGSAIPLGHLTKTFDHAIKTPWFAWGDPAQPPDQDHLGLLGRSQPS